jgi:hypothetical protein
MDNLFDYNSKKNNLITDLKLDKLVFSEQFNSDENLDKITRLVVAEFRYNTEDTKKIKNIVKNYMDKWISLGKFKKIDNDMKIMNDYSYKYNFITEYNKKFINVFQDNIVNDLKKSKSYLNDFNPYRDTLLNNKKIGDFTAEDYKNLSVQTDENLIFDFSKRGSLKNNNENIPIYRQQLHKRQYDAEDMGSLYSENERQNIEYKRFPIKGELFGKIN